MTQFNDKIVLKFLAISIWLFAFSVSWSSALYRISLLAILVGATLHAIILMTRHDFNIKNILSIKISKNHQFYLPIILYLWIALTWFWTSARSELYLHDLWAYTKLLAIPLFSIYIYRLFFNRLEMIIYAYCFGVIVLMLPTYLDYTGLFQFFNLHLEGNASYLPENDTGRNLVYWRNQIIHGFHVSLLAAFLVHLLPKSGSRRYIHFALIALCVFDVGHLIAGRMAIFSLAAAAITTLPRKYFSQRRGILTLAISAILIAIILNFDSNISSRISSIWIQSTKFFKDNDISTSSGIRLYYWSLSFENFISHPLIGAGAGSFRELLIFKNQDLASQNHFHAHNEYVVILSEFGIIGLSIFLYLIGFLFLKMRRLSFSVVGSCVLSFVVVFCVNALSDASLQNIWEGWTFVLLAGVGFALIKNDQVADRAHA